MTSSASGDEDDAPRYRTTRPALDVLDRDQDRLLYDGDYSRSPAVEPLVDGFETYWLALSWYQAAAVRTLGHVQKVIEPSDMMPEAGVIDHLLLPLADQNSAYVRQRLVEQMDDACDLAYRQFRERANERVDNDDGQDYDDIDPGAEKNPLMRPAFRRLDRGQSGALESLWLGFEDRQALGQWVRSLASVTNGEKPRGMLDEIVASPPLLAALLNQESANAQLTRYRFAVGQILPLFLTAAQTLHGGEHTENTGSSHGAFSS